MSSEIHTHQKCFLRNWEKKLGVKALKIQLLFLMVLKAGALESMGMGTGMGMGIQKMQEMKFGGKGSLGDKSTIIFLQY